MFYPFYEYLLLNTNYQFKNKIMLENENLNEPQNPAFLVGAVSSPLRLVSAIKEIENAMERWHHARDEDGETLQKINDILVDIGLLGWFNK